MTEPLTTEAMKKRLAACPCSMHKDQRDAVDEVLATIEAQAREIAALRGALEDHMCVEHREGRSLAKDCLADGHVKWYCRSARAALTSTEAKV